MVHKTTLMGRLLTLAENLGEGIGSVNSENRSQDAT